VVHFVRLFLNRSTAGSTATDADVNDTHVVPNAYNAKLHTIKLKGCIDDPPQSHTMYDSLHLYSMQFDQSCWVCLGFFYGARLNFRQFRVAEMC
jgi:hypothetical protein